jgi:hypothetical protein
MILSKSLFFLTDGAALSALCFALCSVLLFLSFSKWPNGYMNAQASLISQSQKLLPCFNNRMNELQLTTHFVKAF